MENYCKDQTGKTFMDWNRFLKQPNHTVEELAVAISFARNWTTCAVGHQCAIIPRHEDGVPKDKQLAFLGISFFNAIWDMKQLAQNGQMGEDFHAIRRNATVILLAIELRSMEIIKLIEKVGLNKAIRMMNYRKYHNGIRRNAKRHRIKNAKKGKCIDAKMYMVKDIAIALP